MKSWRATDSNFLFAENVKSDHVRYIFNVNIEDADNFEDASSVYLQYIVDLSSEWEVTDSKNLQGVTHQSQICNSKASLGYNFTLDISKQYPLNSEKEGFVNTPLLLFEVFDVNFWNRQRSIGYGFMPFTLKPGSHVATIQTWRPQRRGPAEQLQEYFLGLAPQIESLNYAGIPNNDNGLLARFPFSTETSGSINVRYNTMIQRGRDVLEHEWKTHPYRSGAGNYAVDEVIQAYHRAKQRLKAAHDALVR